MLTRTYEIGEVFARELGGPLPKGEWLDVVIDRTLSRWKYPEVYEVLSWQYDWPDETMSRKPVARFCLPRIPAPSGKQMMMRVR